MSWRYDRSKSMATDALLLSHFLFREFHGITSVFDRLQIRWSVSGQTNKETNEMRLIFLGCNWVISTEQIPRFQIFQTSLISVCVSSFLFFFSSSLLLFLVVLPPCFNANTFGCCSIISANQRMFILWLIFSSSRSMVTFHPTNFNQTSAVMFMRLAQLYCTISFALMQRVFAQLIEKIFIEASSEAGWNYGGRLIGYSCYRRIFMKCNDAWTKVGFITNRRIFS